MKCKKLRNHQSNGYNQKHRIIRTLQTAISGDKGIKPTKNATYRGKWSAS